MVVELANRLSKDSRRAGAEQVVDFVVGQTTTKEPELDLGIVHLFERRAHLLQYAELLAHELRCVLCGPN